MENKSSNWYHNPVLVNILLIVFFPIGLILLWMSDRIAKWWKVTASVIIGLLILFNLGSDNKSPDELSNQSGTSEPIINIDKDQIDSMKVIEKQYASNEAENRLTRKQEDSIKRQKEINLRKIRTLKAENLFYAYDENEIKADQNYKGERFYVEGKIKDFGKDILGDPYITLETGELFSVQCMLNDENVAIDLKKGQNVTFLGTCSGKMANVLMKNCDLVPNKEDL